MRIADVIGTVTLSRAHPSFTGARLRIVVPLSLDNLCQGTAPDTAEMQVCWDELGAGLGSRLAISEGAEAAQPFRPELKPVDTYAAALLDQVSVTHNES